MTMITVELVGNICVGKKSLLEALKALLESERPDLSVKPIAQDLTIILEMINPKKYFDRQRLLVSKVTSQLIAARDSGIPLTIVHRGFYDACAFLNAFVKAGVVTQSKASPSLIYWKKTGKQEVNLVVLVKAPVEEAFKRARKKFGEAVFKLDLDESDIVFSEGFFNILNECYQDLERQLPANSLIVDGSNPFSNVRRNAKVVFEAISKLLLVEENEDNQNRVGGHANNDKISINST